MAVPEDADQQMTVDEPTAAADSSEEVAAPSLLRKKRRSKPLHNTTKDSAAEASTRTSKSPATALKGRKQKQIEVGSSAAESLEEEEEEGADVPMGDDDENEAEAGSSKGGSKSSGEPAKRRKKKLHLSESGDGQQESKWKKGKRTAEADEAPAKKQKKDPNLPKGALGVHLLLDRRRKNPDVSSLSFGEQGKAISLSWKAISAADRKPYDQQAKEDTARYERDVEAYEAEHGPLPKPARKQKDPKPPEAGKRGGGTSKSDASKSKVARKSKPRGGGSSLASIAEEDEESDGGDAVLGVGIGGGRRSQRMPPELDESTLLPRARHPMRNETFGVGDQLVWIPQAYDEFAQAYGTTLRKLYAAAAARLEAATRPADGTAIAAEVVASRAERLRAGRGGPRRLAAAAAQAGRDAGRARGPQRRRHGACRVQPSRAASCALRRRPAHVRARALHRLAPLAPGRHQGQPDLRALRCAT